MIEKKKWIFRNFRINEEQWRVFVAQYPGIDERLAITTIYILKKKDLNELASLMNQLVAVTEHKAVLISVFRTIRGNAIKDLNKVRGLIKDVLAPRCIDKVRLVFSEYSYSNNGVSTINKYLQQLSEIPENVLQESLRRLKEIDNMGKFLGTLEGRSLGASASSGQARSDVQAIPSNDDSEEELGRKVLMQGGEEIPECLSARWVRPPMRVGPIGEGILIAPGGLVAVVRDPVERKFVKPILLGNSAGEAMVLNPALVRGSRDNSVGEAEALVGVFATEEVMVEKPPLRVKRILPGVLVTPDGWLVSKVGTFAEPKFVSPMYVWDSDGMVVCPPRVLCPSVSGAAVRSISMKEFRSSSFPEAVVEVSRERLRQEEQECSQGNSNREVEKVARAAEKMQKEEEADRRFRLEQERLAEERQAELELREAREEEERKERYRDRLARIAWEEAGEKERRQARIAWEEAREKERRQARWQREREKRGEQREGEEKRKVQEEIRKLMLNESAASIYEGGMAKIFEVALRVGKEESVVEALKGFDGAEKSDMLCECISSRSRLIIQWVRALIKAGTDVNGTDKMGRCPLNCAVSIRGNEEVIRLLVANGAKVDGEDGNCMQALYLAVVLGHESNVKALVMLGADGNKQISRIGKSPLDLAIEKGQKSIVRILKRYQRVVQSEDEENPGAAPGDPEAERGIDDTKICCMTDVVYNDPALNEAKNAEEVRAALGINCKMYKTKDTKLHLTPEDTTNTTLYLTSEKRLHSGFKGLVGIKTIKDLPGEVMKLIQQTIDHMQLHQQTYGTAAALDSLFNLLEWAETQDESFPLGPPGRWSPPDSDDYGGGGNGGNDNGGGSGDSGGLGLGGDNSSFTRTDADIEGMIG